MFHAPNIVSIVATEASPWWTRLHAAFLRWYAQPILPRDPLNNPLIDASPTLRIAGALRVFLRGLVQVVLPRALSGDYSAPQEPIPVRAFFVESVAGGVVMLGALAAGLAMVLRPVRRSPMRPVVGVALAWVVVSYFPVSNIPIVLPTVRAERFWYFPAMATSLLLALALAASLRWAGSRVRRTAKVLVWSAAGVFFAVQCAAARGHANDYKDDLVFWDATRRAVPRSAKAHLNYSVMLGARGNLEGRLVASRTALELAPTWPMASIYLGDTLCRLHRAHEAVGYYEVGFNLAPGDTNLIALALQCLWDEKTFAKDEDATRRLEALAEKHPGSWLAYLVRDTVDNGEAHGGVDPKYRPRSYNEGPKGE